ncbi:MAG: SDR family NAD(P)-dependent oxidoreductase, partial [Pseudomonadota bacterium]
MNSSLSGKIALVTGGSRGIGAAVAKRLAADGATVVVTYVGSEDAASAVVGEIEDSGGRARAVHVDAMEKGAGTRAVAGIMANEGALDILVNNAGINIMKPLHAIEDEDYEQVFGVNVRGTLEIVRAASREMGAGGRVIVVTATI